MSFRSFGIFFFSLLFFAVGMFPVSAEEGRPDCWCYKLNERCEHHSWVNDDEKGQLKFTCDANNSPSSCNTYCAKKEGWRTIYCDTTGENYQSKDRRCAAAMAGRTAETELTQLKDVQPKIPLTLGVSVGGKTEVRDLADYIALSYRYAIGIVAIIAIVMLVYGGFRYLLGSAMGDVSKGKTIIKDALIGLIIVLGAYTILKTVNDKTLTLQVPNLTDVSGKGVNVASGVGMQCVYDADCGSTGACLWYEKRKGICADGKLGSECVSRGLGTYYAKTTKGEFSGMDTANSNERYYYPCTQQGTACMFDWFAEFGPDVWPRCLLTEKYLGPKNAVVKTEPKGVGSPCKDDNTCRLERNSSACLMETKESGRCVDKTEGTVCRCSQKDGGCDNTNKATNNDGKSSISCNPGLACVLTKAGWMQVEYNDLYNYIPGVQFFRELGGKEAKTEIPVLDGEWTCQKPNPNLNKKP